MSLTRKVIATVVIVTATAFVVGVLARNLIVNPKLQAREADEDRERIERFEAEVREHQTNLEFRVQRLAKTLSVLEEVGSSSNGSELHPNSRAMSNKLALLSGLGKRELFVVRDPSGTAAYTALSIDDDTASPDQRRSEDPLIRALLEHANYRYFPLSDSVSDIALIAGKPVIFAAFKLAEETKNPDNVYVLARVIDTAFIKNINAVLRLDVSLLSHTQFSREITSTAVDLGVRTKDNQLYWKLLSADGTPVAYLRFQTPSRGFTNAVWVPEIMLPLFFTTLLYAALVLLVRAQVISPLVRIRDTLLKIREKGDYEQRVSYPYHDELGDLADECNDLISHVQDYTRELQEQTLVDALTGLPNRRWFDDVLIRRWEESKRSETRLAVLLFDLDYFKRYNDYHGHDAGNRALCDLSILLDNLLDQPECGLARIGGQEFAAIVEDEPSGRAADFAKSAVAAVVQMAIPHGTNPQNEVLTVSCGVASLMPRGGISPDILLKQAGRSLHQAKKAGRNQSVDFSGAQVLSIAP